MARRNRRPGENERRREMKTYESEPQLGNDGQSESSREVSFPPLDNHTYEAQILQLQNMQYNQIEIVVESPNLNVDQRKVNTNILYQAALRGDWKAAKTILSLDKNNIACTEITERGDTALHIAAAAQQTAFVHNLVKLLSSRDLELQNAHGNTAFIFAAVSGITEIAKVMYEKNKSLPAVRSGMGKTPLEMAILLSNRKMVEFLYKITPLKDLNNAEKLEIFLDTIQADMYDISLKILLNAADTGIVTSPKDIGSALQVLAIKPLSRNHRFQGWIWERFVTIIATIPYIPYFKRIYISLQMRRQASQLVKELWEQITKLADSDIVDLIQETHVIHDAAKIGNIEFLTLLARSYPDLIWKVNSNKYSIFHVAVINRQLEVFNIIYHIGAVKDIITLYIDNKGNNILHLAGKLAPPSRLNVVSGAALQMQRELQWFEEVRKIIRPSYVQMKNKDSLTPRELFTKRHKKLREAGEKWMKDTATSCMVVATLIATVVFAAAFTVPGGYKQDKGAPIFLNDAWFTVFVISDAVAMFSSTASIMTFLSLFTAQYREEDFLYSLPKKLMVGLITLFASIVCMVLTFTATFFLVYKEGNQGTLPKLVASLALFPISLYAVLNCKLWIALIRSTFLASMFRPEMTNESTNMNVAT